MCVISYSYSRLSHIFRTKYRLRISRTLQRDAMNVRRITRGFYPEIGAVLGQEDRARSSRRRRISRAKKKADAALSASFSNTARAHISSPFRS